MENRQDDLVPVCNIVTPVGMLGYGLNEEQTANILRNAVSTNVPTAIVLDSGSTDGGPSKLASGDMSQPRSSYVRDLTKLLRLVDQFHVPLVFSSAGGDGSDDHVRELVGVIEEIAAKKGNEHYKLKTIAVFSEVKKSLVLERLRGGAIRGCGPTVPDLTEGDIKAAKRIVSQMGPEPFLDAMVANPDFNVIVGGRAYDPSPYIAFAAFTSKTQLKDTASLRSQQLWGGFTHMGKIMECGGICATPKSPGANAVVYSDGTFDIAPSDPEAKCTPISVSAHTLYEKSRPDILYGPGGQLDLAASKYEQLSDGRTCRVRGALFTFSRDAGLSYQLKLEAATIIGYRSMFLGSMKDPILIEQIDSFLERVKGYAEAQCSLIEGEWDLDFHVYGKDQISAATGQPSEIFLVAEALAATQELASSIAHTAKVATIHGPYSGQKATSGNLAHGMGGKAVFDSGPCPQFCIYHLMALNEGEERLRINDEPGPLFQQTVTVIGKGQQDPSSYGISSTVTPMLSISPKNDKDQVNGNSERQSEDPPISPATLSDISRVLRSKNSGPYEITFDIMFETETIYRMVKNSGILSKENVARHLEVQEEQVIWSGFFDQALAFKATIPRLRNGKPVAGGGFMENDMHGSQQYLGLFNMTLPESFLWYWREEFGTNNNVS